jgi:hypothetical protein
MKFENEDGSPAHDVRVEVLTMEGWKPLRKSMPSDQSALRAAAIFTATMHLHMERMRKLKLERMDNE